VTGVQTCALPIWYCRRPPIQITSASHNSTSQFSGSLTPANVPGANPEMTGNVRGGPDVLGGSEAVSR